MALIAFSEDHTIAIGSEKLLKIVLNYNIWGPAFEIGIIITLVWTLIECKLHGLWIGPLRVIISIAIPAIITSLFDGFTLLLVGVVLFVIFGIRTVINGPEGGRGKEIPISGGYCIIDGKEQIPIYHISGEKWKGADGGIYTIKTNGLAYDEHNRYYVVGYLTKTSRTEKV